MSDTVVTATEAHQAEVQAVEAEALAKFQESQQKIKEQAGGDVEGVPEGYNDDGTPIEETPTELIGGKFKSQEDLLKAYQELEKKMGGNDAEGVSNTDTATDVDNTMDDSNIPNTSSVDINRYVEEYVSNDKQLSEDSYKELADKGLSKELIDDYIRAKEAESQVFTNSIYEMVGGKDSYTELVTWASENLTEAQVAEFNKITSSNNPEAIKFAVENLQFRFKASDNKPNRLEGTSQSESGGMKPFANKGEWQQATANKLYGRDAKYTAMVDKRYLAATRAGTI